MASKKRKKKFNFLNNGMISSESCSCSLELLNDFLTKIYHPKIHRYN